MRVAYLSHNFTSVKLVRRTEVATTAAVALIAGAVHLPWLRSTPVNWDAVQFALGVGRFDLHNHQPHPPGYLLYILLGRAMHLITGDAALGLSLLSVLFSAAGAALFYRLALSVFEDREIAVGATLLLVGSPLVLLYGSVGLTYLPEMAVGIAVALLAWRTRRSGQVLDAAIMGAAIGLSGGIRQTSLVVLLPLCIWAVFTKGPAAGGKSDTSAKSDHRVAAFFMALIISVTAWLVPLLSMSGGVVEYLHESALLAGRVSSQTSVVGAGAEGLLYNLTFEGLALGVGLCFAVIPLGLWLSRLTRFSLKNEPRRFLAAWALPPLLLYPLLHVGQYGYVLVALPPLMLLAGVSVRVITERFRKMGAIQVCAALAVLSVAYFMYGAGPATGSSITENSEHWNRVRAALRNYDPATTVLIMNVQWDGPFRAAGYLLPRYHSYGAGRDERHRYGWLYSAYRGISTYALPHPTASEVLPLPAGIKTVIALDSETIQRLSWAQPLQSVNLGEGSMLGVLKVENMPHPQIAVQGESLLVQGSKGNTK